MTWPNHFFPDHVEAASPRARVAVVPNECTRRGFASSVSRRVQGKVSQRVQRGRSLYQNPGWWVAGRGRWGMPTSGREVRRSFGRRELGAFVYLAAEQARRGPEISWW